MEAYNPEDTTNNFYNVGDVIETQGENGEKGDNNVHSPIVKPIVLDNSILSGNVVDNNFTLILQQK